MAAPDDPPSPCHPPRMVLLDAVGTLIRPEPSVAAAYHTAGQRHGADVTEMEIQRRFESAIRRHSVGNFAAREGLAMQSPVIFESEAQPDETLLATDPENERLRWQAIVAEVFPEQGVPRELIFRDLWDHFAQPRHWRPFDDAIPFVRELLRRRYRLGVASNFDDRLPPIIERHFGQFELEVYVSSELGSVKPSRRFFQEIETRTGLSPEDLLLVGDDPENDYHAPLAAGWQACLVDRRANGTRPDPDTVADLCDLLLRLPMRG